MGYESTTSFKNVLICAGSVDPLINLTYLDLSYSKLSGTPFLPILPGVVVRVYHCNHVVVVVAAVQVVLQVALQVVVH